MDTTSRACIAALLNFARWSLFILHLAARSAFARLEAAALSVTNPQSHEDPVFGSSVTMWARRRRRQKLTGRRGQLDLLDPGCADALPSHLGGTLNAPPACVCVSSMCTCLLAASYRHPPRNDGMPGRVSH